MSPAGDQTSDQGAMGLDRLWHEARVLVPWTTLLLLPFARAAEIPMVVMAVGGLVMLWRRGLGWLREPAPMLLLGVFACMWVPIAASIPDAARPDSATRIALVHLRFLLVGLFVIEALGTPEAFARFLRLCAWLLLLWVLDAAIQAGFGRDLLGHPREPYRLTGPFGGRGKFGLVLAVLSPLLIEHARRWRPAAMVAAMVALFAVVLLGGTRSGWVTAGVLGGFYLILGWRAAGRIPWRAVTVTLALSATVVAVSVLSSDKLRERVPDLRQLAEPALHENAITHRVWIWRAAWNALVEHPINGVGARGFRHVHIEHAAPGDPFVARDPPLIATHPHHLLLEIGSETGLVGVAGLLLAVTLLARASVRAGPRRAVLIPAGFALGAAAWPLNTHLATYSAYWSVVLWWLVAVYCASYRCALEEPLEEPATRS